MKQQKIHYAPSGRGTACHRSCVPRGYGTAEWDKVTCLVCLKYRIGQTPIPTEKDKKDDR